MRVNPKKIVSWPGVATTLHILIFKGLNNSFLMHCVIVLLDNYRALPEDDVFDIIMGWRPSFRKHKCWGAGICIMDVRVGTACSISSLVANS